ncbi:uncharacterized protein UTRI_03525 [Ustilago trichophora]|uniref:Uncharacterized protein n=1 Tax=Ustilago trichophora TaxID=86804 RepID=A0A5C3E3S5_9BASI|nr:uncharacterized protein UTRI_03525 [Ustilago trichophora]
MEEEGKEEGKRSDQAKEGNGECAAQRVRGGLKESILRLLAGISPKDQMDPIETDRQTPRPSCPDSPKPSPVARSISPSTGTVTTASLLFDELHKGFCPVSALTCSMAGWTVSDDQQAQALCGVAVRIDWQTGTLAAFVGTAEHALWTSQGEEVHLLGSTADAIQ